MNWGETQERALETIKSELTREVTLSRSGPGMYHLHVDSSKIVTASHLIREHKGVKHLMGFGSHTYTLAQCNYSISKQEFSVIWKAVKTWHWYLVGRDVVIHTDHQAWQGLNLKRPKGILTRILIDIKAIIPRVIWIKGTRNVVADCLSRLVNTGDKEVNIIYGVPPSFRHSIIETYHSGKIGPHLSKGSILRDIRQKNHWERM
eukprot:TRINITY_DN2106_c1_g2_i7.p1 TRINITY_DN2106_c1_g2~~TRINITY_DN2106_c1_g2_i7.p1  ORF type:complete len:204 (+),score=1.21 TRINITY_DN2106_c1_g2_i7:593-1204(+)